MSIAHTTPAPSTATADTPRRRSMLRRIAGAAATVATVTVVTIAVWPASAAEQARDDGEQLGHAVSRLYNAQSLTEADAARGDVLIAADAARTHAADEIGDQVDKQADALGRTVDGFIGANTSNDEWDADLYQAELDTAVDDLGRQADDFHTQGPEVQQAFWDGYQAGLDG